MSEKKHPVDGAYYSTNNICDNFKICNSFPINKIKINSINKTRVLEWLSDRKLSIFTLDELCNDVGLTHYQVRHILNDLSQMELVTYNYFKDRNCYLLKTTDRSALRQSCPFYTNDDQMGLFDEEES